jgi:hypothetical protein
VRPRQGAVIVRRFAVATPLSPEDAAALALSVQVALMPGTSPPPQTLARPDAAPLPAGAPAGDLSEAHAMTLELSLGVFHDRPDQTFAHPNVAITYMPWLGHRFGIGIAVGAMTRDFGGIGPGPPGTISYENDLTDLTVRLFVRRQARTGPVLLQLDFLGAVVPFGRFFAGARAGGAYTMRTPNGTSGPLGGAWMGEAMATIGVGWR